MRNIILLLFVFCCALPAAAKTSYPASPRHFRSALTDVSIALEGRLQAAATTQSSGYFSLADAPQLHQPPTLNAPGQPKHRDARKFVTGVVLTSLGGAALLIAIAAFIGAGINAGGTYEDKVLFNAVGVVFLLAAAGLSIPGVILLTKYPPRRRTE